MSVEVIKVYGEVELQEELQKLKDQGIKPEVKFAGKSESGGTLYTLIYDTPMLNEG